MGSIKDRNGRDLTEAEDIMKRWQEYTEERYKKDLHDPDNHDSVITHLEPDILECEVKWALESITTNKASGGDGIPIELFQIRKERRSQDGGGVGWGEHFLPHKFIKRAFKRRVNSTKQLLNASRGHQALRKATQLFERREKKYSSIHQNIDTSFPNQETLTSHLYKPTHSEETPQ